MPGAAESAPSPSCWGHQPLYLVKVISVKVQRENVPRTAVSLYFRAASLFSTSEVKLSLMFEI